MNLAFWLVALGIPVVTAWILTTSLRRKTATGGNRRPLLLALALIAGFPLITIWLYQHVGTPSALALEAPQRPAQTTQTGESAEAPDLQSAMQQLSQRLEENPEDVQGWVLLGRSQASLGRYDQAVSAYEKARSLVPNNADILIALAEAQAFAQGDGAIPPASRTLLNQALELDPNSQKGLWLAGIAARQAGDIATTRAYWQKLLTLLQPGSSVASSVQEQLHLLPDGDSVAPITGPELPITVDISADTRASFDADTAVFVIVRGSDGMPAPVAVKRLTVGQLPTTVRLSDADAMMPQRKLSDQENVTVLARISVSGQPMKGEGDIESPAHTLKLSEHTGEAVTLSLP